MSSTRAKDEGRGSRSTYSGRYGRTGTNILMVGMSSSLVNFEASDGDGHQPARRRGAHPAFHVPPSMSSTAEHTVSPKGVKGQPTPIGRPLQRLNQPPGAFAARRPFSSAPLQAWKLGAVASVRPGNAHRHTSHAY